MKRSAELRSIRNAIATILILGTALMNSGCKLVELKMPGEPMSKEDYALRVQTREFAGILSATVQQAADEIARRSEDPAVKTRAMQWKIGAVSTIRGTTLRGSPALAALDSWAFCRQMTQYLERGPGSNLFGAFQVIAVTNSQALEKRLASAVRPLVSSKALSRMEEFLGGYVNQYPLRSISFERESVAARWEDFEGRPASIVPAGTTSEALSDFSDRLQAIGQQVPEEVRWRLTLESEELERSMARTGVTLDRLDDAMKRIGDAAASSPATISNAVYEIRTGFLPVLDKLQGQWGTTITTLQQERVALSQNLATERAEVLKAVDQQRAAIMKEAQDMSREVIERSMNQLRALVRDILFYAVLLVAVILGIPFLIGLALGRAWGRGVLARTSPKQS